MGLGVILLSDWCGEDLEDVQNWSFRAESDDSSRELQV